MAILLDALALPDDLEFVDEFAHEAVAQFRRRNLGGGLDIWESELQSGQPITLQGAIDRGWAARTLVQQLKTLSASADQEFTLTLHDGSTHAVIFRRDGGAPAVAATPVVSYSDPIATDPYWLVLRFLKVD